MKRQTVPHNCKTKYSIFIPQTIYQVQFYFLINQIPVTLINSSFNNFRFSSDTDIFPDENFNSFLLSATPWKHPSTILLILFWIFNTLTNSTSPAWTETPLLQLSFNINMVSLSKHFKDLPNFLSLFKILLWHYWNFQTQNKSKLYKLYF